MTILPGLHAIALPTPFPIGDVNAYLAEGDALTLIDCGINTEAAYTALTDGLAASGYKLRDIKRLLITHHHVDHVGLARRIVDESGAEVWCHADCVHWLATPDEARDYFAQYVEVVFREGGVPQAAINGMAQVESYLAHLAGSAVPVSHTLAEGDLLTMIGCTWQVYHTPGHAGDLICLYQPDTRVLLSSDHLLSDVSSNPVIEAPAHPGESRPRRLLDYLREMSRIAALNPAIAYTGHGGPINAVRELIDTRLQFHQRRADKLFNLFDGQPCHLYELTQRLFPRVDETQLILALSETLGHLDMLARDGRIERQMRDATQRVDGIEYWQPVSTANSQDRTYAKPKPHHNI